MNMFAISPITSTIVMTIMYRLRSGNYLSLLYLEVRA